MNAYVFAAKRLLRSAGFGLFLFISAVAVFFAPLIGREETVPPGAIVDEDNSEISKKVEEQLIGMDFVLCESEEELLEGIESEEYNCGVVLPDGFGERLMADELDGAVRFITSPTSFAPELYRTKAAASVFSAYAPYITADSLEYIGTNSEEVVAKYEELTESGYLFGFDVVIGETEIIPENERSRTYTLAAGAIFLFALLVYGSSDVSVRDCGSFVRRIGVSGTVKNVLVPGVFVRAVFAMLAMCAALILAFFVSGERFCVGLIPPVCVYILMLSAFSVLLSVIFRKAAHVQTVSFFIVLLSLVLCPLYFDVTLGLPWVMPFRYLLPTYWMWVAVDHTAICAVAAILMLPISVLLITLKWRRNIPDLIEQ